MLTYQEPTRLPPSELVTEVIQYIDEKLKLSQVGAVALYAGIVVDTKNFTFKTGVRTFEAASYLRRQGVDTVVVKKLFQNDIETYSKVSSVVSSAELIDGDIAISVCKGGYRQSAGDSGKGGRRTAEPFRDIGFVRAEQASTAKSG